MKTSNKILIGYFGFIGLLCVANVFVCAHRFKSTLPPMRDLCARFGTDTVRVVKIVEGSMKAGIHEYKVCVFSNERGSRFIRCEEYPAGVRISGDTLIVPLNLHFTVDGPKIESVVLPAGDSVVPPYCYLTEWIGCASEADGNSE